MSKFKDTIYHANELLNEDLTPLKKNKIFENAKSYILLKDLKEGIQEFLAEGEEIMGMLPLTDSENTGSFTVGWMGMSYARTQRAKAYVKDFKTVRGNRFLMFTNQRMLFLFPTDFFESKAFFSYPYESIKGIHLKEHQIRTRMGVTLWYALDFQAGNHVFTETLTEADKDQFLKMRDEISVFGKIPLSQKIIRKGLFDKIFSNIHLPIKIGIGFNLVWIALLVIILLGFFFGIGPISFLRDRSTVEMSIGF